MEKVKRILLSVSYLSLSPSLSFSLSAPLSPPIALLQAFAHGQQQQQTNQVQAPT